MGRSHACGIAGTTFEAKRWLSLNPCGLLGIGLSLSVHVYALVVIALKLLANSLFAIVIYFAAYIPMALLAMLSLFMAATTDPGAVPLGARPLVTVRRAGSTASTESSRNANNNAAATDSQQGTTTTTTTSTTSRRGVRRCHKCQDNFKPPRAHHDSITGRCIVKFDHFCPWVNNAIGALNHKFFCLFLLYTMITCLLALMLLFVRVVHCGYMQEEETLEQPEEIPSQQQSGGGGLNISNDGGGGSGLNGTGDGGDGRWRLLLDKTLTTSTTTSTYADPQCGYNFYESHLVLGLFVASLVFLIFTCSMGCEQIEAIETGKGKIARMKMRVGQAGATEFQSVTEEFNEMFGGNSPRPSWHWFLPWVHVNYPRGMKKVVLGYDWDESFEPLPFPDDSDSGGSFDREMEEMEGGRALTSALSSTSSSESLEAPPSPTSCKNLSRELSNVSLESGGVSESGVGVKNRRAAAASTTGRGGGLDDAVGYPNIV